MIYSLSIFYSFHVKQLGVQYVDLYLIHHPRLAIPDIPTAWKKMEDLKSYGLVKYILYRILSFLAEL